MLLDTVTYYCCKVAICNTFFKVNTFTDIVVLATWFDRIQNLLIFFCTF